MSYISYGFDLWRKIHPLFFCDYLELDYLTPMQLFFKLKDTTKKRTISLCQTDFSVLFVGMVTGGGSVLSQSLFCYVSVYLFM